MFTSLKQFLCERFRNHSPSKPIVNEHKRVIGYACSCGCFQWLRDGRWVKA